MTALWLLRRLPTLGPGWRSAGVRGIHRASPLYADTPPSKPVTSTSYVHGTSLVPLLYKTVGQCLEESANRFPEREALVFLREGVRRTFTQLKQEVEQLAAGLLALGLKKGDRLGVWGPNSYEWVLMQLATAQAGIILVSVNPAYQSHELEFVLRKVGCKALVFPSKFKTQNYYDLLKQVCPELEKASAGGIKSASLPELTTVIMMDTKLPGTFQINEVMQAGSTSYMKQLRDIESKLSCDEPINIQFTSGTTGSPKGATLSHHNIVNNANLIGRRMGFDWKTIRSAMPAPLYHCLGSVGGTMVMLIHGSLLVFPSPSFEGKATLEAVAQEKCTFLYGTPTMYIDMLEQPSFSSYDLSSLRAGVIAGSPVPPELMRKIISDLNMREIVVAYGTTENSPVTFLSFSFDEINRKLETVGHILPHTEAKIVSPETGLVLPLNTSGELMIRGYCTMLGYWNDEPKTKEVITPENWYKTGDIAALDEYGYCRIVGRCKDMIIRGGENIYPAEIEQFLHTHPSIQEAQVIGVKDQKMGEEICACIRLRADLDCTAEDIKAFCKGKISHFKIPRYVVFMKEFPLTVSGKVQKFKLQEIIEKQLQL
ncbi:acyl-CoA synthetase family member 2, mitochondrial-like [Rhinatrema bivittatum]|uniref:acyl-CoA synthetase family member 2, mitochondrial-like n=1 Tax=Rhinatrema bivittatum TaxID=194408 RepID=UPI0011260F79|nr:acyl-CoA synthetase family member 2, mitochondrial-like [Rhinatrema bivittatum]